MKFYHVKIYACRPVQVEITATFSLNASACLWIPISHLLVQECLAFSI